MRVLFSLPERPRGCQVQHSADTSHTFVSGTERLLDPSHKSGTGVDLKVVTKYIFDIENARGAYC